jgi:hypothetical protein
LAGDEIRAGDDWRLGWQPSQLVVASMPGHAARESYVGDRKGRPPRGASFTCESVLGPSQTSAGLDLLELAEYAWHDCYQEITPLTT